MILNDIDLVVDDSPYRHLHMSFAVSPYLETFPVTELIQSSRNSGSDKTYDVRVLQVLRSNTFDVDSLPPGWRELVHEVAAPGNVSAICEALGVNESEVADLEVRLASYHATGWMSRHTDGPDKVFSAIYYFGQGWQDEWGGDLRLYAAQDSEVAACKAFPQTGTGVAFARSDSSWHEVAPVAADSPRSRDTLLLHGYRKLR